MKLFTFLKRLHDDLLELSSHLRFDKTDPWQLDLIFFYSSMIELSAGITILLKNSSYVGIPSLFRTLIETFVEFKNLEKDQHYRFYIEVSYLEQWLRVYKDAKKGLNPYLDGIGKLDLDEIIKGIQQRLDELKARGFVELRVAQKFKIAGMTDFYNSVYNSLCADSHSNLRALIQRHAGISEKDFNVILYKNETIESFLSTIDTTCALLLDASLKIHEHFDANGQERVGELSQEFQKLRALTLG